MPRKELHHFDPMKPGKKTVKQELADLEHRISLEFGRFLVLMDEGSPADAALAKQTAKSGLLKYGPDMQRLANQLGGKIPEYVQEFLESLDVILHTQTMTIDPAKITACFKKARDLEHAIKKAA